MNLNQRKIELKQELPEFGISYIIDAMKELIPQDMGKYNTIVLLESEFKELTDKRVKGGITADQFRASTSDLRDRLLIFIDGLEPADLDKTIRKSQTIQKPKVKKGSVLYQIPKKMQVLQETRCRIRIAFNEELLLEDLELDEDTTIKNAVRVSDRMRVEIIDPSNHAFEVRSTSDLTQLVEDDDYTEWRFYVKPLMPGEHILELKVSIIVIVDGIETKREKTLEESVVIIAEEVEKEEPAFIKMMDDMIIWNITSSKNVLDGNILASGSVTIGDKTTRSSKNINYFKFLFIIPILALVGGHFWYQNIKIQMPFNFRVLIKNKTPIPELPEPNGTLTLHIGSETYIRKNITTEAIFANIPSNFRNDNFRLQYQAEGFIPLDTTLSYSNTILLVVERNDDLAFLKGRVIEDPTVLALEGVRIAIDCCTALTDTEGYYKLEIPLEHQRQIQRVTISKNGYNKKNIMVHIVNEDSRIYLSKKN